MKPGDKHTYERTFSKAEVLQFAEMTGDKGDHHLVPDGKGRVMLHGLLTASMPTKLGGDMQFMAKEMHFEFLKPAWSGERLRCIGTVTKIEEKAMRWKVAFAFEVLNDADELLMKGTSAGNIFRKQVEKATIKP